MSDVLSTEAVKVKPGDPVLLENWGGDAPLRTRVGTVESSGFTKISASGVEEQRVNIVMDFVDPPGRLGDAYRADIRIIVWEGKDVLKVPTSALFRRGRQCALEAEVLSGLREDAHVILHPGNLISDGTRVGNPN